MTRPRSSSKNQDESIGKFPRRFEAVTSIYYYANSPSRVQTATDPDLANIFVPVGILRGIGPRIPTGYVYPCKEIKGISKSQLSLRFRQEKTGWVHSQADRGKSKSKLLSGIFSWERDWVWTPPEAVPNQNCLWNRNHTI